MTDVQQRRLMIARLTARAWADDAFKQRLLEDPRPVLKAAGFTLPPDGVRIIAHENTAYERHIIIPQRPAWWQGEIEFTEQMHELETAHDLLPIDDPPNQRPPKPKRKKNTPTMLKKVAKAAGVALAAKVVKKAAKKTAKRGASGGSKKRR